MQILRCPREANWEVGFQSIWVYVGLPENSILVCLDLGYFTILNNFSKIQKKMWKMPQNRDKKQKELETFDSTEVYRLITSSVILSHQVSICEHIECLT